MMAKSKVCKHCMKEILPINEWEVFWYHKHNLVDWCDLEDKNNRNFAEVLNGKE